MYITDSEKLALTEFISDLPTFSTANNWCLDKVESGVQLFEKTNVSMGCECFWPFSATESNRKSDAACDVCPKPTEKANVYSFCCKATITAPAEFIMNHLTDNNFFVQQDPRIISSMTLKSLTPHAELDYWNMVKPASVVDQDPRYAIVKRTMYKDIDSTMVDNVFNLGPFLSDRCSMDVLARGVRRNFMMQQEKGETFEQSEDAKDLYDACFQNSIGGSYCLLYQSVASNFCDDQVADLHAKAQEELEQEAKTPAGAILGKEEKEKKAEGRIPLSRILAPSNAQRAEIYPGTGFFVRQLRADEGWGSEVFYVFRVALHEQGDITNYFDLKSLVNIRNVINQEWKEHEKEKGLSSQKMPLRPVALQEFLASPYVEVTPIPEDKPDVDPNYSYVPPKTGIERNYYHEEA